MKVNEKNLIAIANASNLLTDKEGWLNKKNEVNRTFQKRWFVLKGNLLYYFEKKYDKEPVGVLIVEGCTVELSEEEEAYCFNLVYHGPGDRTFALSADSQESMEEWMKAIACASYDYMKVVVAELQKQVNELTELERLKKLGISSAGTAPPPTTSSRQRHNPFNVIDRENAIIGNTKTVMKKQTFAELHSLYGREIVKARELWLRNSQHQSCPLSNNLIVL